MVEKIVYQVSAIILLVTALSIVAMLAMGLARATANPSAPVVPESMKPLASEPVMIDEAVLKSEAGSETEETTSEAVVTSEPNSALGLVASEPKDSPFVIKRIMEINEPLVHGAWFWDVDGVPEGELVITVDLKAETMSVFRGGFEIGVTVISFGDARKPTPTGTFPITQKNKDHVSNIYNLPMPYMMRLTDDGIAIHGAEVKYGWGTRGCIGVPHEFAALLFDEAKLGTKVIITDGKRIGQGDAIL